MKAVAGILCAAAAALAAEADLGAIRKRMAAPFQSVSALHLVATREDVYSNGLEGGASYEYALKAGGKYRLAIKTGKGEGILVTDGATTWKALPQEKKWARLDVALQSGNDEEEDDRGGGDGERQQSDQADLRTQLTQSLIAYGLALGKGGEGVALKGEESIKIEGRKADCWVVAGLLPDGAHTLWVDKQSHLVLQRKTKARMRMGNGIVGIESTVKVKSLRLNQEVADNVFAFTPHPKWSEAEFLLLPGEEGQQLTNRQAAVFTLKNLEGDPVSLSELKGKVVVLDFWATWCPPCRKTMPHLEKLSAEMKEQGVAVVGVSDEESGVVKSYIRKQNYSFPILLDARREVNRRYGIRAIPTTLVIDRTGVIRSHFVGAVGEDRLRQAITAAAAADGQ